MDADLSLDVTAPSLGGGRREKVQEEWSDMDLKKNVCWLLDGQLLYPCVLVVASLACAASIRPLRLLRVGYFSCVACCLCAHASTAAHIRFVA